MPYKSDIKKVTRISEAGDFPQVVLIDNCSACNLQCSMCDHKNISKYRKIEIMDMGLYKKIIDEVALMNPNVRIWEIFFGDPFLCKDMARRIKYAKDQGLTDVVLNTNGVLMTADWSRDILNAGLDTMYVGIDAATEKTYNKIRLGGDFHKVVENVLVYRDMLARDFTKKQKIFVQFVISDINEHELEEFKRFWVKKNVGVKIRPRISWAGLIEAKNLRSNNGLDRKPCYWIMKTFNVCADGQIPFCTCDLHCRIKCGNLKSETIRQVWQGELKRYRQMHKERRFNELPEMCQRCSDWQSAYADFY